MVGSSERKWVVEMFASLQRLKTLGYAPDVIFDIGAHHGNWTQECLNIYPHAKYFLFEAIDYPELKRYDGNPNISVRNVLLDATVRQVTWYEQKNTGDSIFREKTKFFKECREIIRTTSTLNDTFPDNVSGKVFMKIDCQGAEISILKGATKILNQTDFILMEMPLFGQYNEGVPTFLEHVQYMDTIGFTPFDIVELHLINNFAMQTDFIFINKKHPFHSSVQERLLT